MTHDKPFDPERFKTVLDTCHQWPCAYAFKFVVAAPDLEELVLLVSDLLPEPELSTRNSRTGKWVSLTVEAHLESADQVLAVYERVSSLGVVLSF